MSFDQCFEHRQISAVSNVFGDRVPERGGGYGESSVTTGWVLVPGWWRQEVSTRGAEEDYVLRTMILESSATYSWK